MSNETDKEKPQDLSQHKIMKLDEEKRNRIINAAMAEFNKGFDKASTDTIVRNAGISKGLLFHYFGSKEKLHEFLAIYALNVMMKEYFQLINFEHGDFLERMWQMLLLKIDLSYKYPAMFDFVTTIYTVQRDDTYKALSGSLFSEVAPKLFAGIDESLFRDDIDPKMAVNIIYWTHIGYSTTQLEMTKSINLKDYQKQYGRYLEEIKAAFDIFRKTFYK